LARRHSASGAPKFFTQKFLFVKLARHEIRLAGLGIGMGSWTRAELANRYCAPMDRRILGGGVADETKSEYRAGARDCANWLVCGGHTTHEASTNSVTK